MSKKEKTSGTKVKTNSRASNGKSRVSNAKNKTKTTGKGKKKAATKTSKTTAKKRRASVVADMTTKQLHEFVSNHNWDFGNAPMRKASQSPKCDLGTALLIYWLIDPTYYFAEYSERSEVPRDLQGWWDFLVDIEQRVAEGFYKTKKYLFDPADYEGDDITYVEGKLKRPIPKEMYGPLYSGPRPRPPKVTRTQIKGMTSGELHEFVSRHVRDDGIHLFYAVLGHPELDAGTALAIYWQSDPHYFDAYRSLSDVPAEDRPSYSLMMKAEKLLVRDAFKSRNMAYDPANDNGIDWTRDEYHDPKRRTIPQQLFKRLLPAE
ncbi:MAG: DUF4274 domain-containing protein [Phycisphaerae bacterium]|nr:DUF4274 domain-containing protein [Phycisphaerae bacterium]